jgi:perosamine synthetase
VQAGDEVIVADFSFPASANVVEDLGARPVFADVSPDTFNLLPAEVERRITKKTKAVMFVDALGNPTGVHAIQELCSAKRIPLIEDAACALGSGERGRLCGAIADVTCFSFHPRKLLTTGEGGAITTQRDEWARWLDVKLNHGATGPEGIALEFGDYGYNFRLNEIQAAMGLAQFRKLDGVVRERNEIRTEYVKALEPLGFRAQLVGADVRYNVQSMVFVVPKGWSRDRLAGHLKAEGVESTIGTYSLSATAYYRKRYNDVQPQALALYENTITLPCFGGVDVQRVIDSIRRFRA